MSAGIEVDARWMIGASGILLAIVQLWLGDQRQRFDNTMRLIERLQDPEARRARFSVEPMREKAGEGFDFDRLTQEERATLASVNSLFGFAGALMRRGRISKRVFLDSWANSITHNFRQLRPYMEWRARRFDGSSGSSWEHFGWLAAKAERHLERLKTRSGLLRTR